MEINAKVSVAKLLKRIRVNCKKHEREHIKAMKGWNRKMAQEAAKIVKRAKSGKLTDRPWTRLATFHKPESHIADYKRTISILQMTVDEEITVSSFEFDQMFNDNWEWKPQWAALNTSYSGR